MKLASVVTLYTPQQPVPHDVAEKIRETVASGLANLAEEVAKILSQETTSTTFATQAGGEEEVVIITTPPPR